MHHHPRGAAANRQPHKRTWLRPAVARIRAGDAENGGIPNTTDGIFTYTS